MTLPLWHKTSDHPGIVSWKSCFKGLLLQVSCTSWGMKAIRIPVIGTYIHSLMKVYHTYIILYDIYFGTETGGMISIEEFWGFKSLSWYTDLTVYTSWNFNTEVFFLNPNFKADFNNKGKLWNNEHEFLLKKPLTQLNCTLFSNLLCNLDKISFYIFFELFRIKIEMFLTISIMYSRRVRGGGGGWGFNPLPGGPKNAFGGELVSNLENWYKN